MTYPADRAPTSPQTPLAGLVLRQALAELGLRGPVELFATCASTNDVARQWQPTDDSAWPEWVLVVAEHQTAGRGRLDRRWSSPAGAGLLFSLSLAAPSTLDTGLVGVLPLATGVAVVEVCRRFGVNQAGLKWPNDIVIAGAQVAGQPVKLGGILAERTSDRVIVGVGVNVDLTGTDVPSVNAGALREYGLDADVTREVLLAQLVAAIVGGWRECRADGVEPVLARYRALSTTLGTEVAVTVPGARVIRGEVVDIDSLGRLLVRSDGRTVALSAGDVTTVRR